MAILLYYALTVEWLCYILFASSIRRILIRIKDFALGTAIYPNTSLSVHWRVYRYFVNSLIINYFVMYNVGLNVIRLCST